MTASKAVALPLGDSPPGWVLGLEPRASRATIWRANQLRHTHHICPIKETFNTMQPYVAKAGQNDHARTCYFSDQVTDRITCQKGFEPPTHGLEGRCSIQLSYWHTVRTIVHPNGMQNSPPILSFVKRKAGDGNRTHVSSLEGWRTNHCTTPANYSI